MTTCCSPRWTAADRSFRASPPCRVRASGRFVVPLIWWLGFASGLAGQPAAADPLQDAWASYYRGDYTPAIDAARDAVGRDRWEEDWRLILMRSYMEQGMYIEAHQVAEAALARFRNSIVLRLEAYQVCLANGLVQQAEVLLDEIGALADRSAWRYTDAVNRVVLGRYYLIKGADPKQVLEVFFDQAKKLAPGLGDAYLAAGELALQKNDYALAADEFRQALRIEKRRPEVFLGLARAYASSDAGQASAFLEQALALNPRHAPSLLWLADRRIDAEQYEEAGQLLEQVLELNPEEPLAWAYRSVLAHLTHQPDQERLYRRVALSWWERNPHVDHLIGRKLSAKYRFAEGAAFQRNALKFSPSFLPAQLQLSQDLLRLGQEQEGWQLARIVSDVDQYNVLAHNLAQLETQLARFRTLEAEGLVVRMESGEAELYGQQALELLLRARETLCRKYQVQLERPVVVEIFPHKEDFAIRTFGLPGGDGYLGVCFGNVITANSPASRAGSPSNWQAVLWHELCHVVTLNKTRNKMPRWLSEGISVYEERQEHASWGQGITPVYRQMLLGDDLTPLSELSAAFLSPKTPLHLQFAYYESSLAVEFLIQRYGLPALLRVLDELAVGLTANEAMGRHCGPINELDQLFVRFAREKAEALGDDAVWERPDPSLDPAAMSDWASAHPDNYWALSQQASELKRQKQWAAARDVLLRLRAMYPQDISATNARRQLAEVYRQLDDLASEYEVLQSLCQDDADAVDENLRLMEIDQQRGNCKGVIESGRRCLAVNPLIPEPYRRLADTAEKGGDIELAMHARRALLALDPIDPAEEHFQLARLLWSQQQTDLARRHVLLALQEAPRYRAAQRLLLEIVGPDVQKPSSAVDAPHPSDRPPRPQPTARPAAAALLTPLEQRFP